MDKVDVKFKVENVEWQDKHTVYLSVYFHSEEADNLLPFFLSDWIVAGLVCVIDSSLFLVHCQSYTVIKVKSMWQINHHGKEKQILRSSCQSWAFKMSACHSVLDLCQEEFYIVLLVGFVFAG